MTSEEYGKLVHRIQRCCTAIDMYRKGQKEPNHDDCLRISQDDVDYIDETLEMAFNLARKDMYQRED